MQAYIDQLLDDIAAAADDPGFPDRGNDYDIFNWISEEEESRTAPLRRLDEWTGISKEALPPESMLDDRQVQQLFDALEDLLGQYNCHFVIQFAVPERIQYETIRQNFDQEVKVRTYHMGFFDFCKPGTEHCQCAMGAYCHCEFFDDLLSRFKHEDLSPEEERRRKLDWEIEYLKRKYDEDWMKYYPYHLDPEYDDEFGNPYNYGFDDDDDDEEDDDWWRY